MSDFFQLHRRTAHFDRTGWKKTILLDWSFVICLGILINVLEVLEPYKREFSLNDKTIQFPYAVHERVPPWALLLIAGFCPLVCLALINAMSVRSFWDLHSAWLGCSLSFLITGIITNVLKLATGRPRPDFIDRCQPQPGSVDHPLFGLSNASVCSQTNKAILFDGFKSFPSGHSSLSFSGLAFLAFYLAGKLHVFHERGWSIKLSIVLCPLIAAASVAVSRAMDNRHHWHDILIGSSLGLFMAWVCYRQLFYPFTSPNCREALPSRHNRKQSQNSGSDSAVREDIERIRLQSSEDWTDRDIDV